MKYLWMLVLLITVFASCDETEEAPLIWDKSDFEQSVSDDIRLVKSSPFLKSYAFFKMDFVITNPWRMGSDDVFYFVKYDSVVATFNGEQVQLNYDYKKDTIVVHNTNGFNENGQLDLTFWGSWYYQDRVEPRYTDGEPVFIETIHQVKSLDIAGELPFKALVGFVESENDTSKNYIPEIEIKELQERNLRRSGIKYKVELEYHMFYKDFDIKTKPEKLGDNIIKLNYYWVLSPGEKYLFSAAANWYYLDQTGNWQICEGFQEYIEKEVLPVN